MKALSDALLPLAETRARSLGARADFIEIPVEEHDLVVTLRCPLPAEYEAWIPTTVGPLRASARYTLIASCLVYPCGPDAEPDLEALTALLDDLPALAEDFHGAIDSLATAEPYEVFDVTDATMVRAKVALGERARVLHTEHKRLKIVTLPEGAPVRALALKTPSRVTWDDYSDGSGLAKLCEKAEAMAHDCIVGIDDKQRCALLAWAPGLAIALASHLAAMAGARRRDPRKKVRRGSSAKSAPTPSTPESV